MKSNLVYILAIAFVLMISMSNLTAQNVSATISGTVNDASAAVVAGANVTLINEASGDIRRTVSNTGGYFAFAAVPPATYTVEIEMQGFNKWQATGIVLNAGDKRGFQSIVLQIGSSKETVTVESAAEAITPVDSGEKSAVINQKLMQNVAIIGQNAAEFIKIMPGMAMTGGALNTASYTASNEGTGNGPVSNFSANGLRTGALDITSDGAHIIDPGCNCGQAVNTNIDMTSELKVMTSNFGADSSKGPVVITAVGKSGGHDFHGEAYLYVRHNSMNANDWLYNRNGLDRPATEYWYPGGNFGGPVVIPGTHFNKNRDKLFFFFATEYYKQDVDNNIYQAVVPTAAMRAGDFSDGAYLSKLNGYAINNKPNYPNGIVPASEISKYGVALMNTYPLDNADPSKTGGWNYVSASTRKANMLQIRPRVDYSINDNTKLYVTYNRQTDDAQNSLDTLWTGSAQSWVSPTTPYPTPISEKTVSDSVSANLTKVFSPTLTNELVFTYTYLNLPNSFEDPSKVERGSLGLDYKMMFDHPNADKLIFPQMTGWSDGIANMLNAGFEINGTVYAKKSMPTLADNINKVWGTHTAKFGFYWERTYNEQPGSSDVNGQAVFANWGGNSTGNAYTDMLVGRMSSYNETNFNTVPGFRYMSTDFYAQDSWKVSRRLTLEYGIRAQHLGGWSDVTGYGFAVWDQSKYSNDPADRAKLTGLLWNKMDSSVPLSGTPTRFLYWNPRFGFAWDLFGTGKTVLRGGYGLYRYHDEQNVQNGAYSITQGSYSYTTPSATTYNDIGNVTAGFVPPGAVTALNPNDDQQPRTQSYSFTVQERLPWSSVLEVAYVGNKADYLNNYNNNFNSLNLIPFGHLFEAAGWQNSYSNIDQYRAMQNYQSVKVVEHTMYSNYNSMQVSWNKQSGHLTFMTNYTFSKALGIRGENGAAIGDPTNLANSYGTLPNNRTHIFNAAYIYEIPNRSVSNKLVGALINNWQVSGITQWQSGSDLQAAIASGANFNFSGYIPNGTVFMGTKIPDNTQMSNQNMIGTGDVQLMPVVTCDPRSGLKDHQFVNGACFAPPAIGTNGTYIFPAMSGPAFFNSDLSLNKNFTFKESQKIQFRVSAYNFLNHPLWTFMKNDPNLNLQFSNAGVLTNSNFGMVDNKTGHRIFQLSVKYMF